MYRIEKSYEILNYNAEDEIIIMDAIKNKKENYKTNRNTENNRKWREKR